MKTLLISVFILLGFFLFTANIMGDASQSQADPDVKLTVTYSTMTQPQVHVVPMSQLLDLNDQINSEPDAAYITTCSYEFRGTSECSTGPYPSCEEAFDVFRDCACDSGNFNPPPSWDCV